MKKLILLLSLLTFFSCKNEKPKENITKEVQGAKQIPVDPIPEVDLIVYMDQLRMRKGPSVEDEEIMRLDENTILKFTGVTSGHTTKIKLRGVQMDAPWLQVKLENGQEGWIYAGGVKPKTKDASKAVQILDDIYLSNFFEEKLRKRIQQYHSDWNAVKTSAALSKVYMEGEIIQEEINKVLGEKVLIDNPGNLLDMSWLERAMIGYQISLVAEGTTFHLFKNFKIMNAKALKTEGESDDYFFKVQIKSNDTDSIEHFFKSWFIQTWDYGGHSLLGQSTHYEILAYIDDNLKLSKNFEQPLLKIKKEILDDIFKTENSYWESKEDIIQEITAILSRDFESITNEEKIALKKRREMFNFPEKNKIEVNQRVQ